MCVNTINLFEGGPVTKDNLAQTSCDENKFAVMGKRHLIALGAFFVSFEDCTGIAWVDKVDPIILWAVSIPEEHTRDA